MTDFDKQLQEIAVKDWEKFVSLVGMDSIVSAKICLMRQNDKSYEQIANRLGVSYEQARHACRRCDAKE